MKNADQESSALDVETDYLEPLEDLDAPRTRTNPTSRLLAFALMAGVMVMGWRFLGPKDAMARDGWISNWDTAVERAMDSGKPALVFFTADWCPACKDLESTTLRDSNLRDYLRANFTLIVVDLTDRTGPGAQRAMEFGVQSIPTLIRYDTQNREVSRTHGMPADSMIQWLQTPN